MKFSVLVSIYKKENPLFFDLSLESILVNQSLLPDQVVIVKDGIITQELEFVLNKYIKSFPKIITICGYDDNKGLGFALNFGLSQCSNEFIFRMDTDDICHFNRFEKQLPIIKKNGISIVGSNIEEFNNEIGDLRNFRKLPSENNDINKFKFSRNPFNHMTVVFKKSIIQSVGGYLEMPGYEDYYLWFRLLKQHKGENINENLVYARVGNDMIARRQGFMFFINEFNFQRTIMINKFISKKQFIKNIFLRGIPRLLPKPILTIFYNLFLRY
jgi:glycosyltransferase involved in cell wall biosynthesis